MLPKQHVRLCKVYKNAHLGYEAQFKQDAMEIAAEEFLDQLFAQISSEAFESDIHESLELDGQGFFISSADSCDYVIMNNSIHLSCKQCIYGVDINCTIMIHVHKETTFEI